MKFTRSLRWLVLALVVIGFAAEQRVSAQVPPPGTTRTGTFVWNGNQWLPQEAMPVAEDAAIAVEDAPPPLPVYVQPPCPEPNLIWMPGYWHHGLFGYYWVPGAWVPAPYIGALWTPGYWGWSGGRFFFHEGYWGPHIGYYGGVNYGGGYMGIGFAGGSWNGGVFAYNTAVVNVNRVSVTNVYINKTIVEQTTIVNVRNVSYNGGPNGVQHQATNEEQMAEHETHVPPTSFQKQHVATAGNDKSNLASNNGGHPTNFAVSKPLAAEPHPAPAGFRPPPPRPVTELAKAQASPEVVQAAHTATSKTSSVPPPAPKPMKAPEPEHMPQASTPPPPKPQRATEPEHMPKAETPPAPKPQVKEPPAPKPAPKPENKPAPKPKPEKEPKL